MTKRIRQLGPSEALPRVDHVLVVKLAPGRFEVSGTAGKGPQASYLAATAFDNQGDALDTAQRFAAAHGIKVIHVKGFVPQATAA
jgi:hypothetical protein